LSPAHSRGSAGGGTAGGNSNANASQSLSLGLVSDIIATLEDEQQPHAREVPALLRELDVFAKRREQRQREIVKQGQKGEATAISNIEQSPISTAECDKQSLTSAGSSAPASPFASAKAGLVGKWSAFKDALGARGSFEKERPVGKEIKNSSSSSGQLLQGNDGRSSSLVTTASTTNAVINKNEKKEGEDTSLAALAPPSVGQSPPLLWKTASNSNCMKQKEGERHEDEDEENKKDKKDLSENEESWGPGLRDRLSLGRSFIAGSEGVNAIDIAVFERKTCVFTASHDGYVKIFDATTGIQLRAAQLGAGQPLTSIALLNTIYSGALFFQVKHPMVLCGSYDGNVYAYNPSAGTIQGQFTPHADAISCLALSSSSNILVTSSWDCSVKLWSLEQGRQPWDSTLPQPLGEVGDLPGGVWALALAPGGDSFSSARVLVGTEEGNVVYLDMRLPGISKIAWQQEVSQDYIGGVGFLFNGGDGNGGGDSSSYYALAACADGTFALLDSRRGGDIVSTVNCGTSLRCCATDGTIAVAGGESGSVHFWDVSQQLGKLPPTGAVLTTAPGLDGLYTPLITMPASPVSSLAVKTAMKNQSGGADSGNEEAVCLATGHEGGIVRVYWAE
jgi:WD40 repeat protein